MQNDKKDAKKKITSLFCLIKKDFLYLKILKCKMCTIFKNTLINYTDTTKISKKIYICEKT